MPFYHTALCHRFSLQLMAIVSENCWFFLYLKMLWVLKIHTEQSHAHRMVGGWETVLFLLLQAQEEGHNITYILCANRLGRCNNNTALLAYCHFRQLLGAQTLDGILYARWDYLTWQCIRKATAVFPGMSSFGGDSGGDAHPLFFQSRILAC